MIFGVVIFILISLSHLTISIQTVSERFRNMRNSQHRLTGEKGPGTDHPTPGPERSATTTDPWGIENESDDASYVPIISPNERPAHSGAKCEPLTIPMCKGLGYNMTTAGPNVFNHENQEEAGMEVHQFWPLVEIQCSPDLRLFLCSMYAPICVDGYHKAVLSVCRSVCERARAGCAPLMRRYGFAWPERMDCTRLPEYGTGEGDELCLDLSKLTTHNGGRAHADPDEAELRSEVMATRRLPSVFRNRQSGPVKSFSDQGAKVVEHKVVDLDSWYVDNENKADVNYGNNEQSPPSIKVSDSILKVKKVLPEFGEEEIRTARFWISVWSVTCLLATFVTVATFVIDRSRFNYPQRPVIYLTVCYFFVSLAYVVPIFLDDPDGSDPSPTIRSPQVHHFNHSAPDNDWSRYGLPGNYSQWPAESIPPPLKESRRRRSLRCYIEFGLLYYFGMANYAWWIILTFTWFLSAGLKWTNEGLTSVAPYFHGLTWSVPALQLLAVLVLDGIDVDPLYGTCSVGNTDPYNLKVFVIIPTAAYLIAGTIFLVTGLGAMLRLKAILKTWNESDRLDLLIRRVGVYALCYTVPGFTVLACYAYEYIFRTSIDGTTGSGKCHPDPTYNSSLGSRIGQKSSFGSTNPNAPSCSEGPPFWVYVIRYFMYLSIGTITAGVWVCSGKTLQSWHHFFKSTFTIRNNSSYKMGKAYCDKGQEYVPKSPHSRPLLPFKEAADTSRDSCSSAQHPSTKKIETGALVKPFEYHRYRGVETGLVGIVSKCSQKNSTVPGLEPTLLSRPKPSNRVGSQTFWVTSPSGSNRTRTTRINITSGSSKLNSSLTNASIST